MNSDNEKLIAGLGRRNPFSTRAIRPGAIAFRFPPNDGADRLLAELRRNGWLGEIVGPHGSGKTSLLHALVPLLSEAGRQVRCFALHKGDRRLPISGADLRDWNAHTQVIVDGYEQLGGWSRVLVKRICRWQGSGLLVTAHESVGMPPLYRTTVSLELAQELVKGLLPEGSNIISPIDVADSLARHREDVREMFFELYDLYERRRGGSPEHSGV